MPLRDDGAVAGKIITSTSTSASFWLSVSISCTTRSVDSASTLLNRMRDVQRDVVRQRFANIPFLDRARGRNEQTYPPNVFSRRHRNLLRHGPAKREWKDG